MRRLSRRRLLSLASLSPVALAARAASARQDPVPPPPSCPAPRRLATVGVAAEQALCVSLFHHEEAGSVTPCLFKIDILDVDGKLLAFHDGEIFAGRGAVATFDVAHGLKRGQRVQVHVNVTVPAGHPIGATAEVFDLKTGETRFPVSPCAEPEPFVLAMGMVAAVRDQIVRVSLFAHLDPQGIAQPCLYKIALYGIDGTLLGANTGQVISGQGVALDFDLAGAAALDYGDRLLFHGDVWVEYPDDVGAVMEIVDVKTGETRYPRDPCVMRLWD